MKIFEHVFLNKCLIFVKLGNIKGTKETLNLCFQGICAFKISGMNFDTSIFG